MLKFIYVLKILAAKWFFFFNFSCYIILRKSKFPKHNPDMHNILNHNSCNWMHIADPVRRIHISYNGEHPSRHSRSVSTYISYACVFMQVDYPSRTAVGNCPIDKGTRIRLVEDLCEWLRGIMAYPVQRRILFRQINIPNRCSRFESQYWDERYRYINYNFLINKIFSSRFQIYFLEKNLYHLFIYFDRRKFFYQKKIQYIINHIIDTKIELGIRVYNNNALYVIINLLIRSNVIDFDVTSTVMHVKCIVLYILDNEHKIRIYNTEVI